MSLYVPGFGKVNTDRLAVRAGRDHAARDEPRARNRRPPAGAERADVVDELREPVEVERSSRCVVDPVVGRLGRIRDEDRRRRPGTAEIRRGVEAAARVLHLVAGVDLKHGGEERVQRRPFRRTGRRLGLLAKEYLPGGGTRWSSNGKDDERGSCRNEPAHVIRPPRWVTTFLLHAAGRVYRAGRPSDRTTSSPQRAPTRSASASSATCCFLARCETGSTRNSTFLPVRLRPLLLLPEPLVGEDERHARPLRRPMREYPVQRRRAEHGAPARPDVLTRPAAHVRRDCIDELVTSETAPLQRGQDLLRLFRPHLVAKYQSPTTARRAASQRPSSSAGAGGAGRAASTSCGLHQAVPRESSRARTCSHVNEVTPGG